MEAILKKVYDGVIFIQGALGDVSTRFTRENLSLKTLGSQLGYYILEQLKIKDIPISQFHRKSMHHNVVDRFGYEIDIEAVHYKLDDLCFIGLPFEVCSFFNHDLLKHHHTQVLSLCDGYLAYLSPAAYFEEHQYEAMMSIFNKGEVEVFLKEIMNEIK